jgi:hypothetical protein
MRDNAGAEQCHWNMTSLMPPQPMDATCESYSEIRVEGNSYPIIML